MGRNAMEKQHMRRESTTASPSDYLCILFTSWWTDTEIIENRVASAYDVLVVIASEVMSVHYFSDFADIFFWQQ